MGGRRPVCSVYIGIYIIYRYISRRVLSVHSSTPPLTAPGAYIYIAIYIAIYR